AMPRDEGGDGLGPRSGWEGRVIDDFRVVRRIGSGGMATVYEAIQTSLDRHVALKVLPSFMGLSEHAVDTFRREALALGRQQHPGIVSIFRVGESNGLHYIAQQLVGDGHSLADELEQRRERRLPPHEPRRTVAWIIDVADALQHAHGSGVVHRDLKPSNILLAENGHPMVSDFGLARIGQALANEDSFVGTPSYAAPEQDAGSVVDHRADIFSLGVTLYELTTLTNPFDGESVEEIRRAVATLAPPTLDRLNPSAPAGLAQVCARAMEKDPMRRYQSMAEFALDLREILQGEPSIAIEPPRSRLGRWLDRALQSVCRLTAASRSRRSSSAFLESWVQSTMRERGGTDRAADARDLYMLAIAQHAARLPEWRTTRDSADEAWETCVVRADSLAQLRSYVASLR
ncbi:MAG: serine/threonine protein kinase, partial [Planctomycetes bacterium]|nr:serine/threonine protein kinase [Planctomycetota bacterium]